MYSPCRGVTSEVLKGVNIRRRAKIAFPSAVLPLGDYCDNAGGSVWMYVFFVRLPCSHSRDAIFLHHLPSRCRAVAMLCTV